jgi:hypothetical protein
MYGLQKTVVGLRQYRPVQQYLSCEEGSKTKPRTSYDPHRDLVREDLYIRRETLRSAGLVRFVHTGVETYGPKHCSSHLSSVIYREHISTAVLENANDLNQEMARREQKIFAY